jgi:hypothetical protein
MILIIHSSEKKMWMQDTSLSLQAKGLMLVLTTQCTSGTSDRETIMSHFTNGDSSFRATLEQLRIRDYVRLNTVRSDAGRYTTVIWEVFDEPTSERTKVDMTISINGMQYPVRKSAAS